MRDISNDPSYKPIEEAMIGAIRVINATKTDRDAWEQFCKDHPNLIKSAKEALKDCK